MAKKIKDIVITMRMSEEEYKPYSKSIEKLGISRSEFFRVLVTEKFNPDIHDKKKKKDAGTLIFYYNKTSNNLNQIARRVNTEVLTGKLNESLLNEILNKLDMINETLLSGIEDFKNGK